MTMGLCPHCPPWRTAPRRRYESKIQIDVHWQMFDKDTNAPVTDEMKSSEFFGDVSAVGLCDGVLGL